MQDKPIALSNLNAAAKSGASGSLLAGASGSSEQSAYMKFLEAKAGFIPELGIPANFFGMPIFIWDKDEAPIEDWKYIYTSEEMNFDEVNGLYKDPDTGDIYKKTDFSRLDESHTEGSYNVLDGIIYLARDYTDMCPYAKKGSFWIFKEVNEFDIKRAYSMKRMLTPSDAQNLIKHYIVKVRDISVETNVSFQTRMNTYAEEFGELSQAVLKIVTSEDENIEEDRSYVYYMNCDRKDLNMARSDDYAKKGQSVRWDGRSAWCEANVLDVY